MRTMVFVSCYLSIHQVPVCEEIYKRLGEDFHYISVSRIPSWRLKSGYSDLDSEYPFVVKAYENEERALKLSEESDVVIVGSAPDKYIIKRLRMNKLTFRCSERFYKKGYRLKSFVHDYISSWIHHRRFRNKKLYMLCASAYTAEDCKRFGNYSKKMYKWGYFPSFFEMDLESLFVRKKSQGVVSILWAGRLVEFKHPEMAISLARHLKDKGISFSMRIVGSGDLEGSISEMISKYDLRDCVKLLGVMDPNSVREEMKDSDIFLFTSDYGEGWGAVVNEAMNSGCAVIACDAAGSVPFLIKDGENGLTFSIGEQERMNLLVERLVVDEEYRVKLGKCAYESIRDIWNAKVAVDRLMVLINNVKTSDISYDEGPCAPIL